MNKNSGGYIGLLLLFIGVAVIIFLAAKQYEKIGLREQDRLRQENLSTNNDGSFNIHPIDRAIDIKTNVEARDRGMLGQ